MILIIDTIQGNYDFIPKVNFGGFANIPKDVGIKTFNLKSFPNFISEKFLINDTTIIYIPLNNNGDFIEIKGIKNIKDTLRVNKISMIESNLPDTTYSVKYWYQEINDSLVLLPNRTEKNFSISKTNTTKKTKPEIILIINGKKYYSTLVIIKGQNIFKRANGTVPKNPYKKNGQRKKNVMKFNIIYETRHWVYKATIIL
ncbi:MAG TPA: hypothetical protein PK995_10715 [Bacteroidia bacterium]|nr:hypothetical protein [Bacteroidia bacterium]